MPNLPYSIELHDSKVVEVCYEEASAVVRLSPAYVHKDGKGWHQDADVIIGSANVEGNLPPLPATVGDGELKTIAGAYHNLLNLPLNHDGKTSLTIEFLSGEIAKVSGVTVKIILKGALDYVEDIT